MTWIARFPQAGLDGVGEAEAGVNIRGTYYTALSQLRDLEYWNMVSGYDDESVVLWLRWSRTTSFIGDQNLTNVTLAVVTDDGQMHGAVYDPERDDTLIFIFRVWPTQ